MAPAFRKRGQDRAALETNDLLQIEGQAELETAGCGRALRSAASGVAREVGDKDQPWCDALFFKFRSQAAPVPKQMFARQHELQQARCRVVRNIVARPLSCRWWSRRGALFCC